MKLSISEWFEALRGSPRRAEHGRAAQVAVLRQVIAEAAQRYLHPVNPAVHERFMTNVRQSLRALPGRVIERPRANGARKLATALRDARQRTASWCARLFVSLSQRPAAWAGGAAAVFVVVGVLTAVPWQAMNETIAPVSSSDADGVIMRGGEVAQRLDALDVDERVKQIERALQANGIAPYTRRMGESTSIQAMVPADQRGARAALANLGVSVPEHGRLNLVVRRKQ